MIIIGEKINGAVPKTGEAIKEKNETYIRELVRMQEEAGANYIDVCAATDPEIEYETLCWLIDIVQSEATKPICIDSPDPEMLVKVFDRIKTPGLINSVSLEGNKRDILFPLLADNPEWGAVALCSGNTGVAYKTEDKVSMAFELLSDADSYGISPDRIHLDTLVFAVSAVEDAATSFFEAVKAIKEKYPTVKITEALSNISYGLPARKALNCAFLTLSMQAGLDSVICDPCNRDVLGAILATDVLLRNDRHCRHFTSAFREGKIGPVKS